MTALSTEIGMDWNGRGKKTAERVGGKNN